MPGARDWFSDRSEKKGPACGGTLSGLPDRPERGKMGLMSRIALYAGSFVPVTNGHLDVVRQAAGLCDRLIVAVGINTGKTPLFPFEERLAMLSETCAGIAKAVGARSPA